MRILIVAATEEEVAPLLAESHARRPAPLLSKELSLGPHSLDVLLTGIGMVATARGTGQILAENYYDIAVNLGLAGRYEAPDRDAVALEIGLGRVVRVVTDRIAEMGVEEEGRFVTMEETGLLRESDYSFTSPSQNSPDLKGAVASFFANRIFVDLPGVSGVTVNTLRTNKTSIQAMMDRFQPAVESMEGAAFMHACGVEGLPCAQLRAVSNYVGDRNRENWTISLAVRNLNQTMLDILKT